MKANFKKSLACVLVYEGGYVNHPKDPGGPTNKGVTQRVYTAWRLANGLKNKDVKGILPGEVEDIYRQQYWNMIRGDELPAGVDLAVFDFAVNSGIKRAVLSVQKVLASGAVIAPPGRMLQDGSMGPMTLVAVEKTAEADEEKFIRLYCEERYRFVKSLTTFKTFGEGWTRRIMGKKLGAQETDTGIIDLATNLARADGTFAKPVMSEAFTLMPTGKAEASDVALEKTPEGAAGGLATLGGAVGGAKQVGFTGWLSDQAVGLGEFAGFTKEQVEPFAQYSAWLTYAVIALGIVGALGVVAVRYKRQKEGRT